MKGTLKLKEDKTWVVEYTVWDDDNTHEVPVKPETMILISCKPGLDVEFNIKEEDSKIYAFLKPSKYESSIDDRVKELMGNSKKIKMRLGTDCKICDTHIDGYDKFICDECFEALKELIIDRKIGRAHV